MAITAIYNFLFLTIYKFFNRILLFSDFSGEILLTFQFLNTTGIVVRYLREANYTLLLFYCPTNEMNETCGMLHIGEHGYLRESGATWKEQS